MPTIFIDNKPYDVKDGQNLLQAALSHGLDVPYFCWHPALGSVGACRQCAIQHFKDENDTTGRMIMSCMTPVAPGMRVSVEHESCKQFRADIIEWMMTNHPHDCPICDEGGECHLQDMTVMTGHNYRRFRFKKRTYKNQNLGPFINHEMNRCITCYRCVRFYRDVAGGNDLNSFASSNRVYFGRYEDGALENEFSGNLVEVCPTGVFTDKPFKHFFNRKWDLQMAPSVCQLCSLGCNIIPGERFKSIRRVQNKYHHEINDYFLCDKGRFGHSFVNSEKRLLISLFNEHSKNQSQELKYDAVTQKIQHWLSSSKRIVGIGSPRASLEANFALQMLVGKDNFFDGLSSHDSKLTAKVRHIVENGPALTASIQNVKEADAVFVLGEDLINTASRLALAIRQNAIHQAQVKAGEVGIEAWHDLAVRNYAREKLGTVFIATPTTSKLEDVAENFKAHPDDIACLGFQVAHLLNPQLAAPLNLSRELKTFAGQVAEVLKKAKNPVIISGISLQSEALLEATANIAWSLCKLQIGARVCFALPEANSMGLNLLEPKPMFELIDNLESNQVDLAVVLENDLSRRISSNQFDRFFEHVPHVVVLDSFENKTTLRANISVASCTFAEGTGTLVNNEGRAQRYYGVFERKEKILESWRILSSWIKILQPRFSPWENLDAITDAMGENIRFLSEFDENVYRANFRLNGQKIPRETQGYSGRTAMFASETMHEPKPITDEDSPLAHSMEGFDGHPPSTLTPFFWAPGWNSVQSLNKYQTEIGGEFKNLVPVIRVFDFKKENNYEFFTNLPLKFQPKADRWQIFPRYFIFGSEERTSMSKAISERAATACIGINDKDAAANQLFAGSLVTVEIESNQLRLPVVIYPELESGTAMVAFGLADMDYIPLPSYARIHVAGRAQ